MIKAGYTWLTASSIVGVIMLEEGRDKEESRSVDSKSGSNNCRYVGLSCKVTSGHSDGK